MGRVKVIGDTLMPNSKEYKIFYKKYFDTSSDFVWYFRKDSNKVYRYIGDSISCMEYKYLDFMIEDSMIWLTCPTVIEYARGIASTFYDNTYYNFLQKSNEAKQFEDVEITSTDTIWTPSDGSFPIVLNRGLGIVWHFLFNDGSYYLQGAIINGVKMGVITSAEGEQNTVNSFELFQNYPNPFNPNTTIKFSISEPQKVKLTIYSLLGEEIKVLVDEYKSSGSQLVIFDASGLSSGVYIYSLIAGNQRLSKKLILLK